MTRSSLIPRLALAAVIACLLAPAAAVAHGDPSSHYLETEQLYPGFANRPSQAVELRLLGLLNYAQQHGYPVKVSIVGSRDDVVEDPTVIRDPQRYAETVSATLGEPNLRAPVVIVTQHGIGVAGAQPVGSGSVRPVAAAEVTHAVAGAPVSRHADGDALAASAERVVRDLAAAGGVTLPASIPPAQVLVPVDDGGIELGPLAPFLVFLAVFLAAWLYYEVRRRLARRTPGPAPTALPVNGGLHAERRPD